MTEKKKSAYIALGIGVAAVSTAAIFVKLSTAPASVIAAYRLLFTVLILGIPAMIYHHKELKSLSRTQWLFLILSGIFLAFHFITWFESLKYTSVASSVVLVDLHPVFAMIGVYLVFKEKVPFKSFLGAMFALAGSVIIGWGDFQIGGKALYGDFLALIGAITVTGYFLIGQYLRQKLSLLTYTFLVYGTSTIVLFLYNLLLDYELFSYDTKEWKLFLALAIIPTIFGHTVFNWVLRYINAATVSTAILGEPIGAAILAVIFLGENVTVTQIIGGTVIISGILIYLKNNKEDKFN